LRKESSSRGGADADAAKASEIAQTNDKATKNALISVNLSEDQG
jgi:hypothetical protein